MSKLIKLLDRLKQAQEDHSKSLWRGPQNQGPNGGVTQSMLQRFLECRERFRIRYVMGLEPRNKFNKGLEYGNMWHACEEALAGEDGDTYSRLDTLIGKLLKRYPLEQKEVIHWYNICKLQFPLYVEWWKSHPDSLKTYPISQEHTFSISYKIPDGRLVRLRGKFDSVYGIGKEVWLQENKTKGSIDPESIRKQLSFDLQTMMYLVALCEEEPKLKQNPSRLGGVCYNVVRRPLGGGRGSIKQKKNQDLGEFYEELEGIIREASGPEWSLPTEDHFFFMRWKVGVTEEDISLFKRQLLDPILTQLCDWWDYISDKPKLEFNSIHYRTPYGLYSTVFGAKGSPSEIDGYLSSGNLGGLCRAERLFKELQE